MHGRKGIAVLTVLLLALAPAPAAFAAAGAGHLRPDDRGVVRGPAATVGTAAVRPDDRTGLRGPAGATATASTPARTIVRVTDGGLDWASAGLGAAAGAGLFLVGALLLVRAGRVGPEAA